MYESIKETAHQRNVNRLNEMELKAAIAKIPYWKQEGEKYLPKDKVQAWHNFVEKIANSSLARGLGLDETIEVLQMIKLDTSIDEIASYIYTEGKTILDVYLIKFIDSNLYRKIERCYEEKAASQNRRMHS